MMNHGIYGLADKWHFRTIGLGSINYKLAAKRLALEAYSTGLFETSYGLNENFIKNKNLKFWRDHENILKSRFPGFGWWIWKPEFVRLSLESIPSGDGLMYLDAGSYINRNKTSIKKIAQYLNFASVNELVGSNSQDFKEAEYCSKKVSDLLSLTSEDLASNQFYGGFLLIKKNLVTCSLVDRWCELACQNDHEYLIPKDKQCIHHAYDQAILSALLKNHGAKSIEVGDKNNLGAIRMIRHRYAYSYDNRNFLKKYFYNLIAFFSQVRLFIERRIFLSRLVSRPDIHN